MIFNLVGNMFLISYRLFWEIWLGEKGFTYKWTKSINPKGNQIFNKKRDFYEYTKRKI